VARFAGESIVRLRSFLYVPVSSDRFVAKAHERGADAIILDLEDAVALSQKASARAKLKEAVKAVGQNGAIVFVRINADVDMIRADADAACRAGAFGLFVPKVHNARSLISLSGFLDGIEHICAREPMRLVPMIEDPAAVLDARRIVTATPRVCALITGGEDLATSLGAEPTPEVLHFPKLVVHYAAKSAGVLSLGLMRTVADYDDLVGMERSVREARMFGFDGASCVHPSVVPILNRAFSPSEEELDRARRLIAAYEQAEAEGRGAFAFEGKMVDEPVVQRARALIARG
jgi:citrate lyase subunit beta/citryl-CoA lyase